MSDNMRQGGKPGEAPAGQGPDDRVPYTEYLTYADLTGMTTPLCSMTTPMKVGRGLGKII